MLAWHRFGPYHHARARAAARVLPLVGLEISTVDHTNMWDPVEAAEGFELRTLSVDEDVRQLGAKALLERVDHILGPIAPSVVVVHGYAAREAQLLIYWATVRSCPLVVMSDSNAYDRRTIAHLEWLKRRLMRFCSAGFVAGTDSKNYLVQLGVSPGRVFVGCDVVDNQHFSRAEPRSPNWTTQRISPCFLTCGRLIGVKNQRRLLEAYAVYRNRAGGPAWKLVVLGDGDLRAELIDLQAILGVNREVLLPGLKQYDELPNWYGAASCFIFPSLGETWGLVVNEAMAAGLPILISNRCGCTRDLVREGVNGFSFDPYDVQGIADLMFKMAHGDVDLTAMGRASLEIIADWGPERFAAGLAQAVEAALAAPPPKPTPVDKALLWALIHR